MEEEGSHIEIVLRQALSHQVRNQSQFTVELRESMSDCLIVLEMLRTFSSDVAPGSLENFYLTDYDLIDWIIRDDKNLLRLYQTCQIFRKKIISTDQSQTFLSTFSQIRQEQSQNHEKSVVNLLKKGNYVEAVNYLNTQDANLQWLGHSLQSLAPPFDQNISSLNIDELYVLDFMRYPKFDQGNQHYLMTLQSLAQTRNDIIDYTLARIRLFETTSWYSTFYERARSTLQYNTLERFVLEKERLTSKMYFGFSRDFDINQGSFNQIRKANCYQSLIQTIYGRTGFPISGEIKSLLDIRGMNKNSERTLRQLGKQSQVLLLLQSLDQVGSETILNKIFEIIAYLCSPGIHYDNNRFLGVNLIYGWTQVALKINSQISQDIIKVACEAIRVEQNVHRISTEQKDLTILQLNLINELTETKAAMNFLQLQADRDFDLFQQVWSYVREDLKASFLDHYAFQNDQGLNEQKLKWLFYTSQLLGQRQMDQFQNDLISHSLLEEIPDDLQNILQDLIQQLRQANGFQICFQQILNEIRSDNFEDVLSVAHNLQNQQIEGGGLEISNQKRLWFQMYYSIIKKLCKLCENREQIQFIVDLITNIPEENLGDVQVLGLSQLDKRRLVKLVPFERDPEFINYLIS